jgi:NADH-quinone oxidoreductase subunit J
MTNTLFFCFSFFIVSFSIVAVMARNLLHAALALIASFFATAALYILLKAEFMALTQVLIYIGSILIFMVFAIFLTTRLGEKVLPISRLKVFLSVLVAIALLATLFYLFGNMPNLTTSIPLTSTENGPSAKSYQLTAIGERLLAVHENGFLIPFEVLSILLLAVLIGAIVIARSEQKDRGKPL